MFRNSALEWKTLFAERLRNFYLTDDFTPGLVFKFVPAAKGTLREGGELLALDAVNRAWIHIDDGVHAREEGLAKGATPFQRPEGIDFDPTAPNMLYFAVTGTSQTFDHPWGAFARGAVLALNIDTLELTAPIVGSAQDDGTGGEGQVQRPDNVRFDDYGTLFVCEDHSNSQFARDENGNPLNDGRNEVLAWNREDGKLYRFAILGQGGSEWTGAYFSYTGGSRKTLFVVNQVPGTLYAVTGFAAR